MWGLLVMGIKKYDMLWDSGFSSLHEPSQPKSLCLGRLGNDFPVAAF